MSTVRTATIRFGCGATAEVDYPEDDPQALAVLREDAARRACPACEQEQRGTPRDEGYDLAIGSGGRFDVWKWWDVTGKTQDPGREG